jgi:hypothetical protein
MDNSILQLVKVIKADPAVANVNAIRAAGEHGGFINIALKPLNVRKISCGRCGAGLSIACGPS